jgi:hypothetical protein
VGLEKKEMIHVLHEDGYAICITPRTLKRLRQRLGLFRRANPAVAQQQAESVLKEEFDRGTIQGYGKDGWDIIVRISTNKNNNLLLSFVWRSYNYPAPYHSYSSLIVEAQGRLGASSTESGVLLRSQAPLSGPSPSKLQIDSEIVNVPS